MYIVRLSGNSKAIYQRFIKNDWFNRPFKEYLIGVESLFGIKVWKNAAIL